jgi:hypothetical protein
MEKSIQPLITILKLDSIPKGLSVLKGLARIINEALHSRRYPARRTYKAALYSIIAVPVLFQSASALLQALTSGYDPVREAVSSLVFGPYGWLQTTMYYFTAASLLSLAVLLYLRVKPRFKWGFLVLGLLGIAFALIGINKPALPGTAATATSTLHVGASIFIAAAFPVACLLLGPILKARRHAFLRWYTIVVGISSLLFFLIGGAVLVLHLSYLGLFERVMLWNGQLWVELVCLQLLLDARRARSATKALARAQGGPKPGFVIRTQPTLPAVSDQQSAIRTTDATRA